MTLQSHIDGLNVSLLLSWINNFAFFPSTVMNTFLGEKCNGIRDTIFVNVNAGMVL